MEEEVKKEAKGQKKKGTTRREFIKKMAYIAPAVTTLVIGHRAGAQSPHDDGIVYPQGCTCHTMVS
mgnify:CR=1 FL=1